MTRNQLKLDNYSCDQGQRFDPTQDICTQTNTLLST